MQGNRQVKEVRLEKMEEEKLGCYMQMTPVLMGKLRGIRKCFEGMSEDEVEIEHQKRER